MTPGQLPPSRLAILLAAVGVAGTGGCQEGETGGDSSSLGMHAPAYDSLSEPTGPMVPGPIDIRQPENPEEPDAPDLDAEDETRALEVHATAYNSVPEQTRIEHPALAAWGDTLRPGVRAIAVSRDLEELGLTYGTEVEIEGLPGIWVVRDRTHERWTERIDVYMGEDVDAAAEWGERTVTIQWRVED